MRLIDADRLKQHYAWWGETENRRLFDDIVDVQPTMTVNEFGMTWSEIGKVLVAEAADRRASGETEAANALEQMALFFSKTIQDAIREARK